MRGRAEGMGREALGRVEVTLSKGRKSVDLSKGFSFFLTNIFQRAAKKCIDELINKKEMKSIDK